jgi:hypothetical protein
VREKCNESSWKKKLSKETPEVLFKGCETRNGMKKKESSPYDEKVLQQQQIASWYLKRMKPRWQQTHPLTGLLESSLNSHCCCRPSKKQDEEEEEDDEREKRNESMAFFYHDSVVSNLLHLIAFACLLAVIFSIFPFSLSLSFSLTLSLGSINQQRLASTRKASKMKLNKNPNSLRFHLLPSLPKRNQTEQNGDFLTVSTIVVPLVVVVVTLIFHRLLVCCYKCVHFGITKIPKILVQF